MGNIQGGLYSLSYVSASAWGSISQFTATTSTNPSTINLFAKGSINASVTSTDALFVSSLADIQGTYTANTAGAQTGTAEVDSVTNISATIKGLNDTSVTAGGSIQGEIDSAGTAEVTAGTSISAPVTASRGKATVWAIGGPITGNVFAGGDADVFSGVAISANVNSGGSATVSSLGTVVGAVVAAVDATVSADTSEGGSVQAGRDASVFAGSVGGDVSAGRNATVVSGNTSSGTVVAGTGGSGDATVQAIGDVTGNVTAAGNATVQSNGNVAATVTATSQSATVLAGGNISQGVIAGTWASVTAIGNLTGEVTARSGNTTVLVTGSITANILAGSQGSAQITAGGTVQGNMSAGQSITVTTLSNITGSISAGESAVVTVLGNEADSITAGTNGNISTGSISASVFTYGNLAGSITTNSGDITATTDGNDSAPVNAAGNATMEVFGSINGNVTAGGSVEVDGSSTIQNTVNAGGSALVSGVGAILLSGHAGTASGGGFEVDGVTDVNASITANGTVTVSSGGNLTGSGESTGADVNASAGGTSTFIATADIGNATVASLGNLSGTITAGQTATGDTFGQAGQVVITGHHEADLSALGGGAATVNSGAGDVNIFSGGNLIVNAEAYAGLQAGGDGTLLINGKSDTSSIQVTAVGSLSGTLNASQGSVTALSVTQELAVLVAGVDATAFAGTTLGGGISAGHDVQAVSYGNIAALPAISAGHDLSLFATGSVGGVFYAGNSVPFFQSDGSIQANITCGSGTNTGEADYGVIGSYNHPLTAWGSVAGTITAVTSIGIDVGGTVTATLTAPAGHKSITQNDTTLSGTLPVLGDVGQAGLAAAVKGMVAQGQQLQSQFAQEAVTISQQLSAAHDQSLQTYQMTQTGFATAVSQTNAALASSTTSAIAVLAKVKTDGDLALTHAKNAVSATILQITTQAAAQQSGDSSSLTNCVLAVAQTQTKLSALPGEIQKVLSEMSLAQANAMGMTRTQLSQGKSDWEQTWQLALTKAMTALAAQQKDDAEPHFFGHSTDWWAGKADTIVHEVLQKTLDGINGVLEQAAGMANLGIKLIAFVTKVNITFQIEVPDFSNGVFVAETPLEHSLSKLIGGAIVTSLFTAGVGEALSGLSGPAEVEELATLEAEAAGGAEDAAGEASDLCTDGVHCFVAGTEVITRENTDGTFSQTPIQDIHVGDYVLSRNQFNANAPAEEELVTAVEQHTAYSVQDVTIRNADGTTEIIQATPTHPFYVESQGFTAAGDLMAGEQIEDANGGYATVVSSVTLAEPQGMTVYNFTVNNDHTYFVDQGGDAVWVHNACSATSGENSFAAIGRAAHDEFFQLAKCRAMSLNNHLKMV